MNSASSRAQRRVELVRMITRRSVVGLSAVVAMCGMLAIVTWWLVGVTVQLSGETQWLLCAALALCALASGASAAGIAGMLLEPGRMPDGVKLPVHAAPSLHRKIFRMARRFGGVRVNTVWVTSEMNAAVLQRPAWGLIGPMETHLLIGLPLAHSISHRQLTAILAHEFAHLAVQRRGGAAWARHLCSWWFRVSERISQLCPFCGTVVDRWNHDDILRAVELSRIDEFEADAEAARVVGSERVAEALIEVALKERFLFGDYWSKVLRQSGARSRPVIRPYREMAHGVAAGFRPPDATFSLEDLCGPPQPYDMHPSLVERLRALGEPAALPADRYRHETSVADQHLKPLLPTLSWVFDRAWWAETRVVWRRHYRSVVLRALSSLDGQRDDRD